ncbi:MAG TPA: hypothetical protein VHY91_24815 [Pirellulales bacterium]|nr:hypothetical protein [Pirellulales bacterium]
MIRWLAHWFYYTHQQTPASGRQSLGTIPDAWGANQGIYNL